MIPRSLSLLSCAIKAEREGNTWHIVVPEWGGRIMETHTRVSGIVGLQALRLSFIVRRRTYEAPSSNRIRSYVRAL